MNNDAIALAEEQLERAGHLKKTRRRGGAMTNAELRSALMSLLSLAPREEYRFLVEFSEATGVDYYRAHDHLDYLLCEWNDRAVLCKWYRGNFADVVVGVR